MFLNNYPAMLPVAGFEPSILRKGAVCSATVLQGLNSIFDKLDFFKEKNPHHSIQMWRSDHAASNKKTDRPRNPQ
jgi:hypothetical protein